MGVVLLLAAGLANPWILGFLLSPTGSLGPSGFIKVVGLEAGILITGLAIILFRVECERRLVVLFRRYPGLALSAAGTLAAITLVLSVELFFEVLLVFDARRYERVVVEPDWSAAGETRESLAVGGQPIFDVTYTLEAPGQRVTPTSNADAAKTLIFFGGSYTFGFGVEDEETLPAQVAQFAPDWRVVNRGFHGQGTGHLLAWLENPSWRKGLSVANMHLVYVYMPHHLNRAMGTMRVASDWGRDFPYYTVDSAGRVASLGTFAKGRPWTNRLYSVLAGERALQYLGADFPLAQGKRAFTLGAALIRKSRDVFLSQVENGRFSVLLYPARPGEEAAAHGIIPFLIEAGITYWDYTKLLPHSEADAFWLRDGPRLGYGHPNGAAHRRVAAALVEASVL